MSITSTNIKGSSINKVKNLKSWCCSWAAINKYRDLSFIRLKRVWLSKLCLQLYQFMCNINKTSSGKKKNAYWELISRLKQLRKYMLFSKLYKYKIVSRPKDTFTLAITSVAPILTLAEPLACKKAMANEKYIKIGKKCS